MLRYYTPTMSDISDNQICKLFNAILLSPFAPMRHGYVKITKLLSLISCWGTGEKLLPLLKIRKLFLYDNIVSLIFLYLKESGVIKLGGDVSHGVEIQRFVMESIRTTSKQTDGFSKSKSTFDERYYTLNKRTLSVVGLWPYQSLPERIKRISVVLVFSFTIMVPQIRAMIKSWGRFNMFVDCFSPLVLNLGCNIKIFNSVYYTRQLRELLDATEKDWEHVQRLPQVDILKKSGERGRRFTIMYFTLIYTTLSGWITLPLVPKIMDAMIPLNHSRARFDIFPTDYMIDPDEYFYPIFIHCSLGAIIGLVPFLAVDCFYMVLSQHVCAMFEILRYNLETMLQEDPENVFLKPNYYEDKYYHQIVSCIKKHKHLVQYIKSMESTTEWCLFLITGLNLLTLSFTGYQTVAKDTPTRDVLKFGMFTICQVFHLFCNSLPGHWIMDSSSYFPDSVYGCRWYMMSLQSRQLIVILIRASIEPCKITAGKIYVMSIENFCTVLQTSMSYLTMMKAMQ